MPRPRKAVSQKQLDANRANVARSTGPRTPQGKARSAQNALKHGFAASTFAVVRLEDLQETAHLRAGRLETGLFTTCLDEALDPSGAQMLPMHEDLTGNGDIEMTSVQNRNYLLGEGFHQMAIQSNSWGLAKRYQAQAERHYQQAVEEFDRLKALRPKLGKSENRPILYAQQIKNKPLNHISVGQTPPSAAACFLNTL